MCVCVYVRGKGISCDDFIITQERKRRPGGGTMTVASGHLTPDSSGKKTYE